VKERKKKFLTQSGLEIPAHFGEDSQKAGEYPFTRGIHDTMYRSRLWTMRQYAGFGTARETNERYRLLLKRGSSGLSVAFDLPTQMGRDPDHPLSLGEDGKVGVSISTLEDMRELFDQIPLKDVSVSMTINSTAAILLAFLIVVAEEQGVTSGELRGTTQNDILKEYIARGTYIYPPEGALRITTDMFGYCASHLPQWNTISISGYHIREAGSTAIQELAFTFANGIAYVESALNAGLKVDDFAQRLAFFFNCHNDFLEEIAKFRAARRIWARLMKERFGAKNSRSLMLRFHTQTAGSSLTAQQPMNNVVRTTIQAMAAVLGGTQSLHTNSYDEALGLPTEESATLALRTQQIIAEESGIPSCIDPFGGSFAVEELTGQIESAVNEELERIESLGGMVKAILDGYPQEAIEKAAYQYQREIEDKDRIIVGVNGYIEEKEESTTPILKVDSSLETRQREKLKTTKDKRDTDSVKASLEELRGVAKSGSNVMPALIKAARVGSTLGEMSDVFREVYGVYAG